MSNVARSINILTWVIYLLIPIIMLSPVLFFWAPDGAVLLENDIIRQYGGIEELMMWQKLLGFFVTCLPAVFLLWSLKFLLQLLSALKKGLWFDEHSELLCRRFARTLLWYVAMNFVHRTLLVLVLTANYPPGEHHLAISISSNDLMVMVPAIFAAIFAHIVSLARAQNDELTQIV